MNGITSLQNIPNQDTGVEKTQNPKQIQGETQINGKKLPVKLMDDSFSQKNTTENKMTFLNDAKHLHQRREVHEKGILHANYEGKGFFGSIGQFFKNIILCLEKNDINALRETLNEECKKYSDAHILQSKARTGDIQGRMERLHQLEKDTSFIKNYLRTMASQYSPQKESGSEIGSDSKGYKILWSAVKNFQDLEDKITSTYKELKHQNK
jgi:hypothetical protein